MLFPVWWRSCCQITQNFDAACIYEKYSNIGIFHGENASLWGTVFELFSTHVEGRCTWCAHSVQGYVTLKGSVQNRPECVAAHLIFLFFFYYRRRVNVIPLKIRKKFEKFNIQNSWDWALKFKIYNFTLHSQPKLSSKFFKIFKSQNCLYLTSPSSHNFGIYLLDVVRATGIYRRTQIDR